MFLDSESQVGGGSQTLEHVQRGKHCSGQEWVNFFKLDLASFTMNNRKTGNHYLFCGTGWCWVVILSPSLIRPNSDTD